MSKADKLEYELLKQQAAKYAAEKGIPFEDAMEVVSREGRPSLGERAQAKTSLARQAAQEDPFLSPERERAARLSPTEKQSYLDRLRAKRPDINIASPEEVIDAVPNPPDKFAAGREAASLAEKTALESTPKPKIPLWQRIKEGAMELGSKAKSAASEFGGKAAAGEAAGAAAGRASLAGMGPGALIPLAAEGVYRSGERVYDAAQKERRNVDKEGLTRSQQSQLSGMKASGIVRPEELERIKQQWQTENADLLKDTKSSYYDPNRDPELRKELEGQADLS